MLSKSVATYTDLVKTAGSFRTDDNVGNAINHYLEHGYVLLHVGTQTTNDRDGKPRHSTVAIMGLKKAARW
jgi:hypothetical protein